MSKAKQLNNGTKKLRPLGAVKDKSIHFKRVESDTHCTVDLEAVVVHDTCQFLSCFNSSDSAIFNRMLTIRETLRQVAVANVCASVNCEVSNIMTLANPIPNSGSVAVCASSESGTNRKKTKEVNFTESQTSEHDRVSEPHREGTLPSLVPPAPPNTASAPASFMKSLTSDRSPPSSSRHALDGDLGHCLHSISINNKDNFRTRQKVEDLKSTSSLSSTETSDKWQRGERSQFILTSDIRVKSKSPSLSSYALRGTSLNHPTAKDTTKSVDMLSVRSSLESKTHYGSVNSDEVSKVSSDDVATKDSGQSFIQKNRSEKLIKPIKSQYEISNCSAVDLEDSIASYVLYGLSPSVSTSDKSATGHGTVKNSNQTANRFPSITNVEHLPPPRNGRIMLQEFTNEDKKMTSFDFSEGLKIVSLNPLNSFSINDNVAQGVRQKKTYDIPERESNKENLSPEGIVGTNMLPPSSTKYLDGLTLLLTPSQFTQNIIAGKKRLKRLNRSKSVNARDKFRCPSPLHIEDNESSDVTVDFSLVGQSLPNLKSTPMWNVTQDFNEARQPVSGVKLGVDQSSQTNWYELESTHNVVRPKVVQSNHDDPVKSCDKKCILPQSLFPPKTKPESDKLDIKKLVTSISYDSAQFTRTSLGKKNRYSSKMNGNVENNGSVYALEKTDNSTTTKETRTIRNKIPPTETIISKSNNVNSTSEKQDRIPALSKDTKVNNFDRFKLDGTWTSPLNESILDNPSTTLPPESQQYTMRSFLDQSIHFQSEPEESHEKVAIEPLYMGCSSQVPDNETASKFHYIYNADNEVRTGTNSKVKVLTALDHDVYSEYQHKKYRDTLSNGNLNTATDKPRLHFIKVRVKDDLSI